MPIVFASEEFLVNTNIVSQQEDAAAAALTGGRFVIAWSSLNADGALGFDVFATVFNPDGTAATGEVAVNMVAAGSQQHAAVAALDSGGFVVAYDGPSVDRTDVFARLFDGNGNPLGLAQQINSFTSSDQNLPAVAGLAGGGWVAAWQSQGQDGSGRGVVARVFDSVNGSTNEFVVNTETFGIQGQPVVAALKDGGYVVGWVSSFQDNSDDGIYAQRFNAANEPVGEEFRINTTTAGAQTAPSVVALPDGGFLFAYQSANVDGSGTAVVTQRYDAAGAALGGEVRINTTTDGDQGDPHVALLGSGGYVVTWETTVPGSGLNAGIFGQLFNANGTRNGGEFRIDLFGALTQENPVAVTTPDGFAAAWQTFGELQGYDVFARRFETDPTVPVFRFYNDAAGAHFYTAGADERDFIVQNFPTYHLEGVAFGAAHAVTADTAPLWRFYNTVTHAHFWTISTEERDAVVANLPEYVLEGKAFDAYMTQVDGTVPVWRFYDTQSGTHFYTSGTEERAYIEANLPQLHLEGIAYYVEPVYMA